MRVGTLVFAAVIVIVAVGCSGDDERTASVDTSTEAETRSYSDEQSGVIYLPTNPHETDRAHDILTSGRLSVDDDLPLCPTLDGAPILWPDGTTARVDGLHLVAVLLTGEELLVSDEQATFEGGPIKPSAFPSALDGTSCESERPPDRLILTSAYMPDGQ